ncbi:MAG: DUF3179 domain-containing protein [Jiangellaceae bacterium]
MTGSSRRTASALALALVLAACDAGEPPEGSAGQPAATVTLQQADASPREDVPSALDDMGDPSFPEPLVDPDEILSGGPPPDGIPAIDAPTFLRVDDVNWLDDTEAVLSLTIEGETHGYPIQVMTWHEIVNDTVGGVPVAATYCPLCNSGVAFDRRVEGRVLSFGTSGRLHASNLVMYDRQTETLWPQLTGQASVGVLTGATLASYPMPPVAWRDFQRAHPDAWVLSRDTGFSRDYGANPYAGYDDVDSSPLFPAPGGDDDRLAAKERVVALRGDGETVAVLRAAVERAGVLTETVDGQELVLWHQEGQASALDTGLVAGGRDIGSVAVFDPTVGGRVLSFTTDGAGFTDTQTGSRWNILGQATDGPLTGEQLTAYPFVDTFWFTWVAFQPATRLVTGRSTP